LDGGNVMCNGLASIREGNKCDTLVARLNNLLHVFFIGVSKFTDTTDFVCRFCNEKNLRGNIIVTTKVTGVRST